MRADALLLVVTLLSSGIASGIQSTGRGGALSETPRAAPLPSWGDVLRDELSRGPVDLPASLAGSGEEQRRWRQGTPRAAVTVAGPGAAATGGRRPGTQEARQAFLDSLDEVRDSLKESEAVFSKLAERAPVFSGRALSAGAFTRYLDHGTNEVAWIRGALGSATMLAGSASEVEDSEMELALLRMAGPRLQSAMFGALLFATWVDFLQLSDVLLRECPMCGDEKLFLDLHRVQGLMEPSLADLASRDPERVEAAALAMPELMGKLTHEFNAMRADARAAMEQGGKVMVAVQVLEMLAMISTLKLGPPRLPPAAPATLGMGLVMRSGGVMVGSQLVVSAEWVEMMRRLVQAGVLSVPVVSAAVRIHGGQVMMAQAHQDLPEGVREALGDSPEVRGMRVTGKVGAGMSEAPKHHVLPQEQREWFEQRGFKGDMDIDQFCVRLEQSLHEAIHGGGNWRLGRTWPGEWNRMIMEALREAELEAGRLLTRNEVLKEVGKRMRDYRIPMNFVTGRRR
ncbi:TIGR02269 family lipoprotein [Myxococcus stipitatus]|nr:TIGR02269 family lipoprotein [Myxococcus stipitatus]